MLLTSHHYHLLSHRRVNFLRQIKVVLVQVNFFRQIKVVLVVNFRQDYFTQDYFSDDVLFH